MPDETGTTGIGTTSGGYVLFAWSPTGYTLSERDGEPPAVGTELENGGFAIVVTKIGASPLPGDTRRCAFTTGRH